MINLTRLWTGHDQPTDGLRYGHAPNAAASANIRKPIVVRNITRTCNLRCIHCNSDSMAAKYPGELDWRQMQAVIRDFASYKIPSLLLSGGEPLIHHRFFDLIDYANEQGLKLTISTNGTLITPEKAAILKAVNVAYVGISLDGIGDIHDKFRGKHGAFKAAVNGFKNCHEVDQKTGLRLTLTRHTVSDIERILDFIEEQQIQRVCFYHLVPSGRGATLQILRPEESRHALDTLIERVKSWHQQGVRREVLTVTQAADGPYLLLRMQSENHPGLAQAHELLKWNGGGNNSSGRASPTSIPKAMFTPTHSGKPHNLATSKSLRFLESGRETTPYPPPCSRKSVPSANSAGPRAKHSWMVTARTAIGSQSVAATSGLAPPPNAITSGDPIPAITLPTRKSMMHPFLLSDTTHPSK